MENTKLVNNNIKQRTPSLRKIYLKIYNRLTDFFVKQFKKTGKT